MDQLLARCASAGGFRLQGPIQEREHDGESADADRQSARQRGGGEPGEPAHQCAGDRRQDEDQQIALREESGRLGLGRGHQGLPVGRRETGCVLGEFEPDQPVR